MKVKFQFSQFLAETSRPVPKCKVTDFKVFFFRIWAALALYKFPKLAMLNLVLL